jgi:hypothetical protein
VRLVRYRHSDRDVCLGVQPVVPIGEANSPFPGSTMMRSLITALHAISRRLFKRADVRPNQRIVTLAGLRNDAIVPEACLRFRLGMLAQPEFRIACFCLITLPFLYGNSRSLCLLAVGRPLLSAPELWIWQNYTRGDVEILAVSLDLNTGDALCVLSGHAAADRSSAASVPGHTIALQPCQRFFITRDGVVIYSASRFSSKKMLQQSKLNSLQ